MEFCPDCGSVMLPKKIEGKKVLVCRKCERQSELKDESAYTLTRTIERGPRDRMVEIDKDFETLPKTKERCPACDNNEAYWWSLQTRSGDEPDTKFLRCTKCSHTWRQY